MTPVAQKAPKVTSGEMPRKPLLFADSYFDDDRIDDMLAAEERGEDPSYIGGYSEMKRDNEIRASKGQKRIPHARYQWVRCSRRNGTTVSEADEQMMEYRKLGYRAAGVEDLENDPVVKGLPPAATVGPDGLIRRGDLALFVVGDKRAERNREVQRVANERAGKVQSPHSKTGEVYRDTAREYREKGALADLAKVDLPSDN